MAPRRTCHVVSSKRDAGGRGRADRAGIRNVYINKEGAIEENIGGEAACIYDAGTDAGSRASNVSDEPDAYIKGSESDGTGNGLAEESNLSLFETALLHVLDEERIDIIVLAGFLKILSADFVKRYPERIINVHRR